MVGAIHSLITADASDYKAALASVESDTGRAFGRVGGIVKAQSRGFRDLSSSIMGIGVVGGVAAAAGIGLYNALEKVLTTQERVTEAVAKERAERDRIIATSTRARRALETQMGLREARPMEDAVRSERDRMKGEADRLSEHALELKQTAHAWDTQVFGLFGNMAEWWSGTRSKADAAEEAAASASVEVERLIELQKKAREIDQSNMLQERYKRQQEAIGLMSSMRIDLARIVGDDVAASRLQEDARYQDQLQGIMALERAEKQKYTTLRDMAQQLHDGEIARIGREASERKRLAEQGDRWAGMDADAMEARLLGHDKESQKIQARIEHEKMLESIRQRSGLDERERTSRMAQADRIHALRLADIEGSGQPVVRSPTIEAGVTRSSALLGQVFGGAGAQGGEKPAREETAKKQLDVTGQVLMQLKEMARHQGTARFA